MVTSQKDQIQSLIADIERVLGAEKPRTPWVRASETESQRQALERAQSYLISLQQAFEAPGGWGPVDPSTGQIAPQNRPQSASQGEPTFTPPATAAGAAVSAPGGQRAGSESADNVLQALLTEMKFLKSSALEPLRLEMDTLRVERDRLNQEVRSLAEQRHQASLEQASLEQSIERAKEANASLEADQNNPEIDQRQLNEFLQALMIRLQENLSRQVTQTLGQLESDHAAAIAKLSAATENELLQLQPRKQIEDMRQLQLRSDQLLVNIDSTLQGMFETLQQNISSYQISLNEGIENMHSLGRQGEVIVRSLVDHLTQQLGQTAPPEPAFFPPKPTALAEPSSAELPEAPAESPVAETPADAPGTAVETVSSLNEILPATAASGEWRSETTAEDESGANLAMDSAEEIASSSVDSLDDALESSAEGTDQALSPEDCIREDGTIDLDLLKLDIDRSEDDPELSRDDLMIDAAIADAEVAEAESDSEIEAKVIPTPDAAFLSDLTLDDLTVDSSLQSADGSFANDSYSDSYTEEPQADGLYADGPQIEEEDLQAAEDLQVADELQEDSYLEPGPTETMDAETQLEDASEQIETIDEPTDNPMEDESMDRLYAEAVQAEVTQDLLDDPEPGLMAAAAAVPLAAALPLIDAANQSVAATDESSDPDEDLGPEESTDESPAMASVTDESVASRTIPDAAELVDRPESAYIPDSPEDLSADLEENTSGEDVIATPGTFSAGTPEQSEDALPGELLSSLEADSQAANDQALTIPERDLDDLTSDLEESVVFESDFNADTVAIEPLPELSPPPESASIPDEPIDGEEAQLAESLEDILLNLENEIAENEPDGDELSSDVSDENSADQLAGETADADSSASASASDNELFAGDNLAADGLAAGHSLAPAEMPPEDFDDDLDFYSEGGSGSPESETLSDASEMLAEDAIAGSSEASEVAESIPDLPPELAPELAESETSEAGSGDLPPDVPVGASLAGMSAVAATAAPSLPNLPPLETPPEADGAADISADDFVSRVVSDGDAAGAEPAVEATAKADEAREPATEEGEADPTGGEPADWFLGIDFGTTGLSAVLINQRGDQVYPLCWNVAGDNEANRFRLPAVMQVSTDANGTPVAGEVGPVGLQQEVPLLRSLKLMVKAGIPDAASETPLMQWTEQIALPLVDLQSAISDLFKTMTAEHMSCRAVGLQSQALRRALLDLRGVIVGYPTNWPDTYSFNIREAVLTAGLVDQPDQVFFIEESLAALLSALPIPTAENDSLENQPPGLYNCNWSGGTVVLSAGTTLTEAAIANLPNDLNQLSYADFARRSYTYAGDGIDQDIVCQLMHVPLQNGGEASSAEEDGSGWASLGLNALTLPQPGEADRVTRHRLRQRLNGSPLGREALAAARELKVALQEENEVDVQVGDRTFAISRKDIETKVFLPYIQRINRQINALLSQQNLSAQGIKQVVCTGGSASLGAIARWLRQKFPNATIIQDTYSGEFSNSCSRVAYGLANLCHYPNVLDANRHQYNDYFLLMELLRILPEQPLPAGGILHLLEQRGIDTQGCQAHVLALIEGHLPPGLVPTEGDRPLISAQTSDIATYQALAELPLFRKQGGQIYTADMAQGARLRDHLESLLSTKAQSLSEPMTTAHITASATVGELVSSR